MSPHTHLSARHHNGASRTRRVAIFGGSFDPVHIGHLAVALAAQRRFHLEEIHFVPCGRPPHKMKHELAPFLHRYAMVSLASAEHRHLVASLAEAGHDHSGRHVHYSVDTVRHFRQASRHAGHHLYFITGADAFLELPTWKNYETLLDLCEIIVVSRPGFRLDALRLVIPPEMLRRPDPHCPPLDRRAIALRKSSIHLLDTVHSTVSATEIRRRIHRRQSINGLVPPRVEEYIHKQALYL